MLQAVKLYVLNFRGGASVVEHERDVEVIEGLGTIGSCALYGNRRGLSVKPELFVESRNAMGAVFTIYLYACDRQQVQAAFEAAFEEIERLDDTLSNYRASSELSRINRLAGCEAVTTDPEVFEFLETALAFGQQSDGAFDITVGPLMRAWGFFRGEGHYPSEGELREARESVGFEKVYLHPPTRRVRFATSGVELDPGAIGKGYAVDRTVAILREAGIEAALVDAGSSTLFAMNAPPGESGWTVRVPMPEDRSQTISTLTLRNQSLSTSGNYEKFFQLDGKRYCHVMDPRLGTPVQGVLQATLVAPDSTTTDALSNAMFVTGPEVGRELLASVPDARGLWVLDKGEAERVVTWNWEAVVEQGHIIDVSS
jgi:thiamine biosynthesis lipoprotein